MHLIIDAGSERCDVFQDFGFIDMQIQSNALIADMFGGMAAKAVSDKVFGAPFKGNGIG